ncbi:hypothetical protein ACQ86N_17980 [Puia sp. P3]|uniref:hypothetical protein n=1 Tax=Puia sp. P3 TaxID=3423952 RepID=UPI003D66E658
MKLGRCGNPTSSSLDITDCNYYSLNNKTFDRSGTYTQVIPNKEGCDSVITLNLTLTKKFTEQAKTICDGDPLFRAGKTRTGRGPIGTR